MLKPIVDNFYWFSVKHIYNTTEHTNARGERQVTSSWKVYA